MEVSNRNMNVSISLLKAPMYILQQEVPIVHHHDLHSSDGEESESLSILGSNELGVTHHLAESDREM